MNIMENDFLTADNSAIRVSIFWGIKDINKDNVDPWDPADLGDVVFDDKFDMSPITSQQSLMDFCKDLREQSFIMSGQVTCWIDQFD